MFPTIYILVPSGLKSKPSGLVSSVEKEKDCKVSGCDYSSVAIDWTNKSTSGKFTTNDSIDGFYDTVIAMHILEHLDRPVKWMEMALKKSNKVIVMLPNNFRKVGEHVNMRWSNWKDFYGLFDSFEIERVDEGQYPDRLHHAFRHPIFIFRSKENASIHDSKGLRTNKKTKTDSQNKEGQEEKTVAIKKRGRPRKVVN